ncbi:4-hydroxy-tetrahydrodipicolinate synthase [Cohnella sp. CFH 77786]|uniref:4-hydroxy-tetrahydrodipicolinate synthase n=1 Tax=Cohnella sp. CFH 77786 TaxID=2662265 RepID=UPI001C60B832|nr:4-hydroxy-tetrahydrodipicolinate synthase [Cohnella sp. CFH 77786]MBW5447052.1 4-hydroxy-tetrahydrodipicolinate synthase [Cohnella sp. CFH 77786]
MPFVPQGIIPALVTPFHGDEEINENALRVTVRRLIGAGVHGLFCLGSNGEFFALSYEEKIRVASIVADEAAGAVPVFAGSGAESTRETIRLTRVMKELGVSAASVITPAFLKLTQAEMVRHYQELAAAVDLPILLYNIPSLTGNSLSPQSVGELSRVPSIIGIKDSSGAFDNILGYLDASASSDFAVLAGTDSLILSTLMAGGTGAVAATANVAPETVVAIYEKWRSGDYEGAEREQRKLRPIRSAFKLGTMPSVLKEMMNALGVPAGWPRAPVNELGESARQQVLKVVQEFQSKGE